VVLVTVHPPVPYSPVLEAAVLPSKEKIEEAILRTLAASS
jgi:pyruvate/2-oxoglutarate/acetoin dehydrogenase E1 component